MLRHQPKSPRHRPSNQLPTPTAASRTRTRSSRVSLRAAQQSWVAALIAFLLYLLRSSRMRLARESLRHESFANPSLASLLHLHGDAHAPLSLHIYAAPKPFVAVDRVHQLRALESWLALTPRPTVTLLGDAAGYAEVAAQYGLRRRPHVDTNFLGVPLFSSMLAVTNASTTAEIFVLMNADIILYDDFPYALRKIRRDFPPAWLAVAARWDVDSIPDTVPVRGPGVCAPEAVRHRVVEHARSAGVLHTYGGIDLWAWDSAAGPLVYGPVPPFVYGRGKYDNWLTHEVIRENRRAVVDISEACTLVHVKHDHHLVTSGMPTLGRSAARLPAVGDSLSSRQQFWSSDARGKFELFVNSYLAAAHGTYSNQMGTILHAPLKLTSCYEHDGFCIFQRVRPHSCRCEHSPYVAEAQNDPYIVKDSRVVFCGLLSANFGSEDVDGREKWAITGRTDTDLTPGTDRESQNAEVTFGLPLIQEHIFKVIASRTGTNKVFLVVADYSERALVMELACSMRAQGLFQWLMIAALDNDLYRFCITRGLPVFLSEFDESQHNDHANFKELARFQVTSEALRKGKEVYCVEPGVVFASTPWDYFTSKVSDDVNIAVLPRVPSELEIGREKSYISSAFIFARPGIESLDLMKKVMIGLQRHDAKSGLLLRVLGCGENDEGLRDSSRCNVKNGAVLHLFDEQLFRTIEEGDCLECKRRESPIAYYSATFGLKNNVPSVISSLVEKGLSRIQEDLSYCKYASHAS